MKTINITAIIGTTLLGLALLSCQSDPLTIPLNNSIKLPDSLTFNFAVDTTGTKSALGKPKCTFGDGISMAIYYNGNKVATGSCSGSNTTITISPWSGMATGKNHNVYAIANSGTNISWPNSESSVENVNFNFNDMGKQHFPMANTAIWNGTTNSMTINLTSYGCYEDIYASVTCKSGINMTSVNELHYTTITDLYPFNDTNGDLSETGNWDYASSSDLSNLLAGHYITLYTPKNCANSGNDGYVKITRKAEGFNYNESYSTTIDPDNYTLDFYINGTSCYEREVTDTRTITFSNNTTTNPLNITGNGSTYTTRVSGRASNGDTDWSYTLSWNGVSSCNTKINYNGTTKNLDSNGSFLLSPIFGEQTLNFTSSYSENSQKEVILTATSNPSGKTASMKVVITKMASLYNKTINLYFDSSHYSLTEGDITIDGSTYCNIYGSHHDYNSYAEPESPIYLSIGKTSDEATINFYLEVAALPGYPEYYCEDNEPEPFISDISGCQAELICNTNDMYYCDFDLNLYDWDNLLKEEIDIYIDIEAREH